MDAGPPCRGDHKPRGGHNFPITAVQGAAQKRGFRWRRPRHTLKGRQDPDAIDRVGLRLKLRKAQAEAGDLVLLFSDESEALTHPYLARAWAKRGADLRVPAPGQSKKVAMMGTLAWTQRKLIVTTSRTRAPTSSRICKPSTTSTARSPGRHQGSSWCSNGPIHVSKATRAALAERAHWLTVEWLPKYAPELNDIEVVSGDLKAHHLAHQTFTDPDVLDESINHAVDALNLERKRNPLGNQRLSA